MSPFKKKLQEVKSRTENYDEVFLKNKDFKARQPVYISKEIHQGIKKVVHLLALSDQEISIGSYINNVLTDHLEYHKEDIAELRQRQIENLLTTNNPNHVRQNNHVMYRTVDCRSNSRPVYPPRHRLQAESERNSRRKHFSPRDRN